MLEKIDGIPRTKVYRTLEIITGSVSWLLILLPPILAIWFPTAVAVFIVVFVIFWVIRIMRASAFFFYSYFRNNKFENMNWGRMLSFFSESAPTAETAFEEQTAKRIAELKAKNNFIKWTGMYNVVIIPTYKEEKEILDSTFEALTHADFPAERLCIVLATEERDRARGEKIAQFVEKKYAEKFGQFHHVMHPANLPDELPAKGANVTYAGIYISKVFKKMGIDPSCVLVTTLDADNRPHRTYFSNLTYHYLMEPERKFRSYQPLSFFYNNIWEVPFINRVVALANTFWYFSESGEGDRFFNSAAHAQSLEALEEIGFWSRDTVVEDLQQYWRAFFTFKGNHRVLPIFVPIYQDALQNKTYFTSLVGQYKQLRRWAWGASVVPYSVMRAWKERKGLPLFRTIQRISYMWYLQVMWACASVIMVFNEYIPRLFNPDFHNSLIAYNTEVLFGVVFQGMRLVGLLCIITAGFSLPSPPPGRFRGWRFIKLLGEVILLPFITIIYGSISALDAQTRLMLNKPLGFNVTEKIRKESKGA